MTDELDLLRAANPVRADAGPWRDRPLDAHAERGLNRLLHSRRTRRAGRRLALRAEAAVFALVAVLAFAFSDAGTSTAAAAPAALVLRTDAPPLSLDELARRAEARARTAGAHAGPRRGSHLQSWYMSMEAGPDAAPPVTVPEERITRWRADGSGSELVVATDPRHPGRPVINDADGRWRTVNDGKVLHRKTYPAGSGARHGGFTSRTKPPTDAGKLREFLATVYGGADAADVTTPQLLPALSAFRQEWTPGPRETAAMVRMLADTGELRPAGSVTDRLGRRGQAYVYDGPDGSLNATRQVVVLDPVNGQLLGSEITFTKDLPDFEVKSGEVLSYEAWMP
ncbi:2-oxoglutarate dehydrogenase [Streptomyces piniterrae]|uniref:2-oxoglutarate dehydrogenase n=1 Tax=Streptomyces piniterrae TaxID=2571125 RepID=A0A4U0NMB5_9ACTN|nr:CU044_5270 family protein [Streptomyces piniterrae]TJZ55551.1 2-oxoglutarate dehydrogenase [Streptomyces piniterrae]